MAFKACAVFYWLKNLRSLAPRAISTFHFLSPSILNRQWMLIYDGEREEWVESVWERWTACSTTEIQLLGSEIISWAQCCKQGVFQRKTYTFVGPGFQTLGFCASCFFFFDKYLLGYGLMWSVRLHEFYWTVWCWETSKAVVVNSESYLLWWGHSKEKQCWMQITI